VLLMPACFFATDLHGRPDRFRRLFAAIRDEAPAAVFLGGDLLPGLGHDGEAPEEGFIEGVLAGGFRALRADLGEPAPRVFLIFGNDDPRREEAALIAAGDGLWEYAHGRRLALGRFAVYGYACVPPTPFRLKDWERYDVSRFVDPGCLSPEEGVRTVPADEGEVRWGTIQRDLASLAGDDDLRAAVMLFHSPPYDTPLDRAGLDGVRVDHAPADVHVGSIAIRRFIEARRPLVTLHGHVHEAARLTGRWRTRLGPTHCFSAAHDGPELALVRFDPEDPEAATRELLAPL
jgi:Icc-related predicted phosphoesterase